MPRLAIALALSLLLAACQLGPVVPAPPPAPQPGQLAYIGRDGNIYLTDGGLSAKIALTTDATAPPEGEGRSYHRISWSPDGRLAFAAVTRAANTVSSQIYVTTGASAPPQLVAENEQNFVIYLHWSPAPCPNRPACRHLAYLIEKDRVEASGDIGLHLLEIEGDAVANDLLGLGRPFFFSWHPEGRLMAWHTGGARRFNAAAQLARFSLDTDRAEPLSQPPGLFLAPAWSPTGEGWLGVLADDATDRLHLLDAAAPQPLAEALDNQFAFVWSPDGRQAAYAIRKSATDPLFNPIHIVNVQTGQSRRLTDRAFRIAAFFWSPDGEKLAYLQQPAVGEDWLQWRVYNLRTGIDRGFAVFVPSYQMLYVLGSFNQYAQSHRLWSADSRYLVYADRDEGLVQRVWLVDTANPNGAQSILVDEGTFGVWSWE
ncbi:MAG: PD40 domain-containing protein [Anaerolineae bacterium]